MRICLLTTTYPPRDTEGIARQRQVLANELARQGHAVHVVTCAAADRVRREAGVVVHEVRPRRINHYSYTFPGLDSLLSQSQALHEGLRQVDAESACDVVDVPLWSAQGLVSLQRSGGRGVVWLQTTRAQLFAINGRSPTAAEKALLALERACLQSADGWLADSRAILAALPKDYGVSPAAVAGVAHLGLPELGSAVPERLDRGEVEALVVGRLERRKGTPLLLAVLPALLHQFPRLKVRFVGRDNSAEDGWQRETGEPYPDYFCKRHPELRERVAFDGYVDEARLAHSYAAADFLLAPSVYESFGLMYLEAMRVGLPVITFAAGAAPEVFPEGEGSGGLLVPPADDALLVAAIGRLVELPDLRRQLGHAALERFHAAFTATAMARATLEFYQQVVAERTTRRSTARVVFQVMEALDFGDAVSNITRRNAALLAEIGQPSYVLARGAHESVRKDTRPLAQALATPECGLIFHYWGYNTSTWLLHVLRGPKAVHYHNITPPHYFPADSEQFRGTSLGYAQLPEIASVFDLVVGDSRYNVLEFAGYLACPRPSLALYPVVEPAEALAASVDTALLAALRKPHQTNVVFVGRVARNKRQDRIMQVFDYYFREVNRHACLWLVGSDQGDPQFRAELEHLRETLKSGPRITFTGKIPDAQVNAYYRAADVFVSASEHEGFGVPLAQAMAFDVPVLAFAAAAVPETLGGAGLLIHEWDTPRVAELMHLAVSDEALRTRLCTGQRAALGRFSAAEARRRLTAIVRYLTTGEPNDLFEVVPAVRALERA